MRKCPYCAEEIKEEAIKCKHCGSEMPEVQQKIIEEQTKAAVAQEQVMAAMDSDYAKKMINLSYLFIFIGLVFGFVSVSTNKAPWYSVILWAYCFWSAYWGVQIVHNPIKQWYSGLFVWGTGVVDLMCRQVGMILGMYLITIPLIGLIIGALGGGFIRTLKYVAIANNNVVGETAAIPKTEVKQLKPTENFKLNQGDVKPNEGKPNIMWLFLGGIILLVVVCIFIIVR